MWLLAISLDIHKPSSSRIMRQYAVIVNLESEKSDRYTMSSLPLHLTILSIFFSDKPPSFFTTQVIDIADDTRQFNIKTTGRALFGINEDISVTLVKKNDELRKLHLRLLDAVSDHVSFRAPQFLGDGYGPHITDQGDREAPGDGDLLVGKLMLVEIIDQDVLVRSDHILSSAT